MSDLYGPQTMEIEALIERLKTLTEDEADALHAARNAAWYAARTAAQDAARNAALYAAWYAAWYAADAITWDAAEITIAALVVRDLISDSGFTQEHYDLLSGPWRRVVGPIHPDDADLREKP